MSDRLYQNLIGSPLDGLNEEVVADEIASTVLALGRQADSRPLPVGLDWSNLRIELHPSQVSVGHLQILASAPVR